MKIHHREEIVQKARFEIMGAVGRMERKHDLHLDDPVQAYSQAIVNLKLEEKTYLSDYHKELEELLSIHQEKHSLTYGEMVQILTEMISHLTKYIIRWERHEDLSKEGGLE